jgi:hypothetical protein
VADIPAVSLDLARVVESMELTSIGPTNMKPRARIKIAIRASTSVKPELGTTLPSTASAAGNSRTVVIFISSADHVDPVMLNPVTAITILVAFA